MAGLQRAVQQRQRAADAPAQQRRLLLLRTRGAPRAAPTGSRRRRSARGRGRRRPRRARPSRAGRRRSPRRAGTPRTSCPGRRSKMSGRLMSAKTSRTGTGVRALGGAVAVERRRAVRPHHVLGRHRDLRVALGQHDVRELERGDRGAGHALEGVHARWACAGARRRLRAGRGPGGRRGRGAVVARALDLLAQALDLLQDQLELVLGAAELARQARDVAPAGQPQVAPHEVHRVEAHPRERDDVLGRHRQQLAERVARDHALGGLCHARLGLLVEAASLLLGCGTVFGHR